MNKILVVGDIYIETELLVDKVPQVKEFAVAKGYLRTAASKSITTARVLAMYGDFVEFFGKAGQDDDFLKVISDFKNYRINFNKIIQSNKSPTGQINKVTDANNKSALSILFGANASINSIDIAESLTDINEYQMVYGSTHLALESLYKLIDMCKFNKVPLFLDFPNPQRGIDLKMLEHVDYVCPNREESEMLFNEKINTIDDAFRILFLFRKFCKGTLILTLDIDGCAVLPKGKDEPIYFKTNPVQSVDGVGAGDIFRGVFISKLLKTRNLESSIQAAQQVASASVKFYGLEETFRHISVN